MRLSVVVPTCDRPESLARLLAVLAPEAAAGGAAEIVVVDDGSGPEAAAALARLRADWPEAPIAVHARPVRGGPSAARNSGVAFARGAVIAFLDDDVLPEPGFVAETLRLHAAHPEALLINGNLVADRDDVYSRFWFHYYDAAFNRGTGAELYPIERVSSGHFSIKRTLLDRIEPLFDETLPSREDYDLYLRLAEAGITAWKADSVTAGISCRRSLGAFLRQRAWYRRGEVHIRRKHGAERIAAEQARHRAPTPWHLWHLHLAVRLHAALDARTGGAA